MQDFKFVSLEVPENNLILGKSLTRHKLLSGFGNNNTANLRTSLDFLNHLHLLTIPELDNLIRRPSPRQ